MTCYCPFGFLCQVRRCFTHIVAVDLSILAQALQRRTEQRYALASFCKDLRVTSISDGFKELSANIRCQDNCDILRQPHPNVLTRRPDRHRLQLFHRPPPQQQPYLRIQSSEHGRRSNRRYCLRAPMFGCTYCIPFRSSQYLPKSGYLSPLGDNDDALFSPSTSNTHCNKSCSAASYACS